MSKNDILDFSTTYLIHVCHQGNEITVVKGHLDIAGYILIGLVLFRAYHESLKSLLFNIVSRDPHPSLKRCGVEECWCCQTSKEDYAYIVPVGFCWVHVKTANGKDISSSSG